MTDANSVRRIIDANFNRAREALRVMEDFARFVLNDALLTESCKSLRHDASSIVARFADASRSLRTSTGGSLVESRNILGDVGRELTADGEYARADAAHTAMAAGKRLSESLRSIEEYGKTIDSALAARVEEFRYRGYELERRLALAVRTRDLLTGIRLYVLITETVCQGDWLSAAEAALDGGADCLQLREKELPDGELFRRARSLTDLCRSRNKLCIINDRPDIAAAAGAHGVHLGQDDLPVAAARQILPTWAIVGVSTHSLQQAEVAAGLAPNYVAIGPMFPSRTKPQDHVPGPQLLTAVAPRISLPLVAIGGIDERNVVELLKIASPIICVCGAIIGDADPAAAARRFRERIDALYTEGDS